MRKRTKEVEGAAQYIGITWPNLDKAKQLENKQAVMRCGGEEWRGNKKLGGGMSAAAAPVDFRRAANRPEK